MTHRSLLIKPASSGCNMRCDYCFYADVAGSRSTSNYGVMSHETLQMVVKRALNNKPGALTLAFQGGEPTLAGLPFFREVVRLTKGARVNYALQTNGYLIDEEWAEFFAKQKFLIGLSLDGNKDIHDAHRKDARGEGTFTRTVRAADALKRANVDFNLLTVVTAQSAKRIASIYNFFCKSGFLYQQYIPCLSPFGVNDPRGLTNELYAEFLKTLFDAWYADVAAGRFIYIRYFENLVGMMLNRRPESCNLNGHCAIQNVVEADGSVYPCDFYVLDDYRLGSVYDASFDDMAKTDVARQFIEQSLKHKPECTQCRWYHLCRGGCRRERDNGDFCDAYRAFFTYAHNRLRAIAARVKI